MNRRVGVLNGYWIVPHVEFSDTRLWQLDALRAYTDLILSVCQRRRVGAGGTRA
jgi:hypothetical protein